MTISNFVAYVKQAWKNKPDTSTPLSAARLTHLEDGIKGNSDAIEKIAAAVVSQIVNDPNKIASMASLYSVNQAVTQLNSDLEEKTSYPKPMSGAINLASTNINSHRVTSIIALNVSDIQGITNLPVQAKGVLRTTVAGSYCIQEYFTDTKLYARMYNGSAWSNWV